MGLLKNIGYTIAAILVIACIVGIIIFIASIGMILAGLGLAAFIIWLVACTIKEAVENRQ